MKITKKNMYCTKDIAKWIRQTLKKEFKDFKFSVRKKTYSGGASISVSIMKSPIRLIKKFKEVTKKDIRKVQSKRYWGKKEAINYIKNKLNTKHYNINQYYIDDDLGLTKKGKKIIKKVYNISNKYNWDKNDIATDYFNVNYYLNISLGKWNKPFKDGKVV